MYLHESKICMHYTIRVLHLPLKEVTSCRVSIPISDYTERKVTTKFLSVPDLVWNYVLLKIKKNNNNTLLGTLKQCFKNTYFKPTAYQPGPMETTTKFKMTFLVKRKNWNSLSHVTFSPIKEKLAYLQKFQSDFFFS